MDEALRWKPEGVPLRLDADAESADSSLPALISRPEGAPVYHGLPLLEESRTSDGWCFGTISDPACPEGLDWGDAFVVAPDGSRAGLIWQVGAAVLEVSVLPEQAHWGVYKVGFTHPVHNDQELVEQLREWLPELRRIYREWRVSQSQRRYGGIQECDSSAARLTAFANPRSIERDRRQAANDGGYRWWPLQSRSTGQSSFCSRQSTSDTGTPATAARSSRASCNGQPPR